MYDELVRAKNIKGWQPDYKHEDASLRLREGGMNEDFKRKVSAR